MELVTTSLSFQKMLFFNQGPGKGPRRPRERRKLASAALAPLALGFMVA